MTIFSCAKETKKYVDDPSLLKGELTVSGLSTIDTLALSSKVEIGQGMVIVSKNQNFRRFDEQASRACEYTELSQTKTVIGLSSTDIFIETINKYRKADHKDCLSEYIQNEIESVKLKYFQTDYSQVISADISEYRQSCRGVCELNFKANNQEVEVSLFGTFKNMSEDNYTKLETKGVLNFKYPWLSKFKKLTYQDQLGHEITMKIQAIFKEDYKSIDQDIYSFLSRNELESNNESTPAISNGSIILGSERSVFLAGSKLDVECPVELSYELISTLNRNPSQEDLFDALFEVRHTLVDVDTLSSSEARICLSNLSTQKKAQLGEVVLSEDSITVSAHKGEVSHVYSAVSQVVADDNEDQVSKN